MMGDVSCFLPCRKGSQRVPRKNIKPFAGNNFGLIELKLKQLLNSHSIGEIILSTNDEEILCYAHSLKESRIRLHQRVDTLSSSETSTDQLIAHAFSLISTGHILWTHVTSPFISSDCYDRIIRCYQKQILQGYDSLMTTTAVHSFLWQNGEPLNYNRQIEKWPRTQTLNPIYEVNSGVFLAPASIYAEHNDRIGQRPYLYELDKITGHDIDWPEDFLIAACMVEKGMVTL